MVKILEFDTPVEVLLRPASIGGAAGNLVIGMFQSRRICAARKGVSVTREGRVPGIWLQ